jgi:cathepsin F
MRMSGGNTAIHGVTKFMDLSPEEFKATYLKARPSNKTATAGDGECTACVRFPEHQQLRDDPPAAFDWTTKGAVTPVKDQGQCGSCWSFGTMGDIEGTWFLAKNDLVSLSEQELVSCDSAGEDQGCNGGLQEDAFQYVISKGGLVGESDYPYVSGGGNTGKCDSSKAGGAVKATISSWSQVSKSKAEEGNIKTALIASGPITIGINAGHMQTYRSGVDNPLICLAAMTDHAVLIVGYGTDGGSDYWKIKNSWATSWGEDGYYRIVSGKNKCGVATDAVHSKV